MRYLGGKSRISKPISEVINNAIPGWQIENSKAHIINPNGELGGGKEYSSPCSAAVVR